MSRSTFSCLWSEDLGRMIQEKAQEHCPTNFRMTLNKGDYETFAKAWNMGIDSYLEGFTQSSADASGTIIMHPQELHILVRRLMENVGSDRAISLASSICEQLEIELI